MNINDIPLIIPNFNQLTYLRNLINWWKWYYPENPVIILDNESTETEDDLTDYYYSIMSKSDKELEKLCVYFFNENDFVKNLTGFIAGKKFEYYCISDPDIMLHPATPPNFLEIFKHAIDTGYHHAGFGLITDDIPDWNVKKGWIQGDENALLGNPVTIEFEGKTYGGFKAPIDTTFALYKRDNGGWQAPQTAENWTNSLRLFKAFHLGWYIHPDHVNEEMKHYYATCKKFEPGMVSAGLNNYRP